MSCGLVGALKCAGDDGTAATNRCAAAVAAAIYGGASATARPRAPLQISTKVEPARNRRRKDEHAPSAAAFSDLQCSVLGIATRQSRHIAGEDPEVEEISDDDVNDLTFHPELELDPEEDTAIPLKGAVDSVDELTPGSPSAVVTQRGSSLSGSGSAATAGTQHRARSPNTRSDLTSRKKTRKPQPYRPSADPDAQLRAMTGKALRRACRNRRAWMHGLLLAVSKQHSRLRRIHNSLASKQSQSLRITAESFQVQLDPIRIDESPPPLPALRPAPGTMFMPPATSAYPGNLPSAACGTKPQAPRALPGTAPPAVLAPKQPVGQGAAWTQNFGSASSSGGVKWKTPEQVPPYPGMGMLRPMLACEERMATSILALFVASGKTSKNTCGRWWRNTERPR